MSLRFTLDFCPLTLGVVPARFFPKPFGHRLHHKLPDVPAKFDQPTESFDYVKRVVMIPMRDGVKLYTVIVTPKGAKNAPMIFTRTPYNAAGRATRNASPHMLALLPQGDEVFVADGYIRVFQDIRGKYGSEGDSYMTRALHGPLNSSNTDESTDAYDTIDWLVKNVPESNGKVGMLGSSYEGFTVVMALVNPHPALKVAAPMSPMVDGWMGDDWFHYGAFREANLDYFSGQTSAHGAGVGIMRENYDDYENFLRAGSAGDFAQAGGLDQLPWWHKVAEHPAYDSFWSGQALDQTMAEQPLKVPDHVDSGNLGPGRYVGHDPFLFEGRTQRHAKRHELPCYGPVAAQRGELRRVDAGSVEMGRRYRTAIPPRCTQAVLRSVPERRCAQGRYAAGFDVQHRRKSLGSVEVVAVVV